MRLLALKFKKKSKDPLYVGLASLFIQEYHPTIKIQRYESKDYIVMFSDFDYFLKTITNIINVAPSQDKLTIVESLKDLPDELVIIDDEISSMSLSSVLKHKTVNPTGSFETKTRNQKLSNYLHDKECFVSLAVEYYKSEYFVITREPEPSIYSMFRFLTSLKEVEKNPLILIYNSL